VTLLPNPSHLEAVNPVAVGKARYSEESLYLGVAGEDITLLKTFPLVILCQSALCVPVLLPPSLCYRAKHLVRGKGDYGDGKMGDEVLCVQIHGDAALAGQVAADR
jgi:2-oxoglutarate dehydrogenase complex dehydrogenase (E1) component-like enzyme